MPFSKFGLHPDLLRGVKEMGFTRPTPIQQDTIPPAVAGKDVLACAMTGSGKTAAFGLPILNRLIGKPRGKTRALIITPTRELAAQIEEHLTALAVHTPLSAAAVFGGVGMGPQEHAFRHGVDVIVATPGRLLDHFRFPYARLDALEVLVLDEADRMLDMGFLPDVRRIVERCPRQRHTSLFSATIPIEIESLVKWAMKNPQTIEIGVRRSPAQTVKHVVYAVAEDQKSDLLRALLGQVNWDSVIVFCRTKNRADRIGNLLRKNNHAVAVLHSNRTQREREQALRGFRDGRYEVLVATDIAARGLDVAEVSHVINFDVPQHPEDYVHRIGRTGRAESTGDAFTLMVAEDRPHMAAIERFIGRNIERVKLDSFNYKYTSLFDESKDDRSAHERKVKGVRLSGGYYFGPAKRRRR